MTAEKVQQKSGFIAIMGQPNAGKSTLLNACTGQKIVGVSRKAQTTRNQIAGIVCKDSVQYIFLDTPGIHKNTMRIKLNSMMNREAWSSLEQADVVCYLIDINSPWNEIDKGYIKDIIKTLESREKHVPLIVLLSKTDRSKKIEHKEKLLKLKKELAEIKEKCACASLLIKPILLSAKNKDDVSMFLKKIGTLLPTQDYLYEEDDLTDKPEKFIVGEMIREQVFRYTGQEIPYCTAVVVDQVSDDGGICKIYASVVTDSKSHKGIVIGAQGQKIKHIGTEARKSLEDFYQKKVHLDLNVQVSENWISQSGLISHLTMMDL